MTDRQTHITPVPQYESAVENYSTDMAVWLEQYQKSVDNDLSNIKEWQSQVFLNIMDYGAVGNGTADDTTAIQNALNDAFNQNDSVVGGVVFVPPGNYLITAALTIYSDTTLFGISAMGNRSTRITATTDITMIKTPGVSGTLVEGVGIKGINFRRNLAGATTPHINIINPIWCTIEDVYVEGSSSQTSGDVSGIWITNNGVSFAGAWTTRMNRVAINNGGVKINNVTDTAMTNCDIWASENVDYALELIDAGSSNYHQTDFINGLVAGVYARDSGANRYNYSLVFDQCTVIPIPTGVTAAPSFDMINCDRMSINNCQISSRGEGIKIEDCYEAAIIGNAFNYCGLGTRATSGDNNTGAGGPYGDIRIIADAQSKQGVIVSGNSHRASTDAAFVTLSPAVILEDGDSAPSHIIIRDESVSDTSNYTSPIFNLSDGTDPITFKDCHDSAYGNGSRVMIPYYQDNVAANQAAVRLSTTGGALTAYTTSYKGSIVGIAIRTFNARTAGTLTVEVSIDGVGTGFTITLDGANTFENYSTVLPGTYTFAAEAMIGALITTDAAWLPVTADIQVDVVISI